MTIIKKVYSLNWKQCILHPNESHDILSKAEVLNILRTTAWFHGEKISHSPGGCTCKVDPGKLSLALLAAMANCT